MSIFILILGVIVIAALSGTYYLSHYSITPFFQQKSNCHDLNSLSGLYAKSQSTGPQITSVSLYLWDSCTGKNIDVLGTKDQGIYPSINYNWVNSNTFKATESYCSIHPRYGCDPFDVTTHTYTLSQFNIPNVKPEVDISNLFAGHVDDAETIASQAFNANTIDQFHVTNETQSKILTLVSEKTGFDPEKLDFMGSIDANRSQTRAVYYFTNTSYKNIPLYQTWLINLSNNTAQQIESLQWGVVWLSDSTFVSSTYSFDSFFFNVSNKSKKNLDFNPLRTFIYMDNSFFYYYIFQPSGDLNIYQFNINTGDIRLIKTININNYSLELRFLPNLNKSAIIIAHTKNLPIIYSLSFNNWNLEKLYDYNLTNSGLKDGLTVTDPMQEFVKVNGYFQTLSRIGISDKYLLYNGTITNTQTNQTITLPVDLEGIKFKPD